MPPHREKNAFQDGIHSLLRMGRRFLGEREEEYSGPERRASRRTPMRLPVRVCVTGNEFLDCHVVDINLGGLSVQPVDNVQPRQNVAVSFEGFPGVVPPFTLSGEVVRILQNDPRAIGLKVNRTRTSPEVAGHYRNLIRHYLRHRPLLEEVNSGFFEGRCSECGWLGRVGNRRPDCPCCGGIVKPLHGSPGGSPSSA